MRWRITIGGLPFGQPSDQANYRNGCRQRWSGHLGGHDRPAISKQMATGCKGYDLSYAWRAVGVACRGAGSFLAAAEAGSRRGQVITFRNSQIQTAPKCRTI